MGEVLRKVGRYEILRSVGRGGMALVYLARQTDLDRFVALKELAALHDSESSHAWRFVRESRVAGSLSHPSIVVVHDYFVDEGTPYIAMEFVAGGSLRPHVGTMTLAQIAGVLESVLAGLAHAESQGIVHRDLKPENLMVTTDGRVKIADFGIAKATTKMHTSGFATATGTTVGTPAYMAPEQAMGQEVGPWTDLYSVGCIAWELFTGKVPFHDTEAPMAVLLHHINDPVPPAKSIDPAIDQGVSDWIEHLLVKDPNDRTRTATEAWDDFEEIVIGLLGPRWRRHARLTQRGPATETADPLTPAPFEGPLAREAGTGYADTPPDAAAVDDAWDTYQEPPQARPPTHTSQELEALAQVRESADAPPEAGPRPPAPETEPQPRAPEAEPPPHDPEATVAPRRIADTAVEPVPARGTRRWRLAAVAALGVVAVAAAAAVLGGGGGGDEGGVAGTAATSASPSVLGQVSIDEPWGIAASGDSVWVTNRQAGTLTRVDGSAHVAGSATEVAGDPVDVAVADRVWVADRRRGDVVVVDPATGAPDGDPIDVGGHPSSIAAHDRWVWVADFDRGTVRRIDVRSRALAGPPIDVGKKVNGIAAAEEGVWAVNFGRGTATRIDPERAAVAGRPVPTGAGANDIAIVAGSAWVSNFTAGTVTRLDAGTGELQKTFSLAASCVAGADGALWAAVGSTVVRVDPATNRVSSPVEVGGNQNCLRGGARTVWVAVQAQSRVVEVGGG